MGQRRNGSSTWIVALQLACRLSHMPGFLTGLRNMIGTENADALYALWTPLCDFIEDYRTTDDWPFKKDFSGGEPQDITV